MQVIRHDALKSKRRSGLGVDSKIKKKKKMISPAQNSRCPSNRIFVFGACLSRHVTFSLTSLQSFNSYTHFAHVSNFFVLKKKKFNSITVSLKTCVFRPSKTHTSSFKKTKTKEKPPFFFFSSGFAFISSQTIRERKGKPSQIIWELFSSAKRNFFKKGGRTTWCVTSPKVNIGSWTNLRSCKKIKVFFCSFLFSVLIRVSSRQWRTHQTDTCRRFRPITVCVCVCITTR